MDKEHCPNYKVFEDNNCEVIKCRFDYYNSLLVPVLVLIPIFTIFGK